MSVTGCKVRWIFKRYWTVEAKQVTAKEAKKLLGAYWFGVGRESACEFGHANFSEFTLKMPGTGAYLKARRVRKGSSR